MTKLESVDDIRKALLELISVQESIADDDDAIRTIQRPYQKLVDRFYYENEDILAYQQYQAAKNDPEYFMQLVIVALHHYEGKGAENILH